MRRMLRLLAALALAGAAGAQGQPAGDACGAVRAAAPAADARALAVRAQCVLAGDIPSSRRFEEARELASNALALGEPAGGYLLYLAFTTDPANTELRDGKPDPALRARLAARPAGERQAQAAALDGLAFATRSGHVQAALLLANYLHTTTAPHNVARLRGVTTLLLQSGERSAAIERMNRQSSQLLRHFPATKVGTLAFGDVYKAAIATAGQSYRSRNGNKACDAITLKSLQSGDLQGAEFLPLKETLVADSYLVKGRWSEAWVFSGCGQELPVLVSLQADGWGGARYEAAAARRQN